MILAQHARGWGEAPRPCVKERQNRLDRLVRASRHLNRCRQMFYESRASRILFSPIFPTRNSGHRDQPRASTSFLPNVTSRRRTGLGWAGRCGVASFEELSDFAKRLIVMGESLLFASVDIQKPQQITIAEVALAFRPAASLHLDRGRQYGMAQRN